MTGITIGKERRPLAMFEYSDNGQHIIAKIMQHGDKYSVTEKHADEWLAHITSLAGQGMYDPSWVAQFKAEHDAFLKGNELPREGTPVRTWGGITREQGTRLIALNLSTLEDLAAVPDSGLGVIGLDGRVLRDLAKNYIASQNGAGEVLAKRLADAEQTNREQAEQIKRMEAKLSELAAAMPEKRETLHAAKKGA